MIEVKPSLVALDAKEGIFTFKVDPPFRSHGRGFIVDTDLPTALFSIVKESDSGAASGVSHLGKGRYQIHRDNKKYFHLSVVVSDFYMEDLRRTLKKIYRDNKSNRSK